MIDIIGKYLVEIIVTGAVSGFGIAFRYLIKKQKEDRIERKIMKNGILALLHRQLYADCRKYIADGKIKLDDMKSLEYLYREYTKLGGNGTGTELFERCKKLELIEDKRGK